MTRRWSAPCLALAIMVVRSAAADGIAAARLDPPEAEHPPVFARETVRGVFHVENTGTESFRIVHAKTTCHCTTAVVNTGTIAPGEKGEIEYAMDSAAATRRSVSVYVETNPPLPKPLVFKATASWTPLLLIEPASLRIQAELGKPVEHRVPIRAAEGAGAITITGATTRQTGYALALEPPPPGQDFLAVLVIRTTNDPPPRGRALRVSLAYERGEAGSQDLTFEVNVHSDFIISPTPLIVKLEEGVTRTDISFTVINTQGRPFTLRSIRSERFAVRSPKLSATPAARQPVSLSGDFGTGPIPPRGTLFMDLGKDLGVLSVDVHFNPPQPRK
ncbi:MAG: DUF1573 domain-containing protein [Candidatus Hydrogenedentes bacterium]|nr:DUF1573 domain-containing protein [Candidatus Hydrogenedentota bacterium]